jgi:hypothetical protein
MRCWRRGTKNERPRLGAHAELTPWDAIQGDFDPDSRSLLCEVFIYDAAVATWQAVLDTIRSRIRERPSASTLTGIQARHNVDRSPT